MSTQLQTIGYEGLDSEVFLWMLGKAEVAVLVDVRRSARSRRRAFNRTALEQALEKAGIRYLHMPELGVAAEVRMAFKQTRDFRRYRQGYLRSLKQHHSVLEDLWALVTSQPCCLMCLEKDPQQCHRSVLADYLSRLNGRRMPIRHL